MINSVAWFCVNYSMHCRIDIKLFMNYANMSGERYHSYGLKSEWLYVKHG